MTAQMAAAPNASSVRVSRDRFIDEGIPHGSRHTCRRCGNDATTSPVADLVVVFRECGGCSAGVHWVEQLAHRRCFASLVAADVLRDQAADHASRGRSHASRSLSTRIACA